MLQNIRYIKLDYLRKFRISQDYIFFMHFCYSACCGEIFVLPQNFCINSDVISFNTSTMTSPCTICTTTANVMENVTNTSLPDADAEFYLYYTCSVMNTGKMNTVLNNSVTFSSDSYFQ